MKLVLCSIILNCSAVILAAPDRSAPAECEKERAHDWIIHCGQVTIIDQGGTPLVRDGSPSSHQTMSISSMGGVQGNNCSTGFCQEFLFFDYGRLNINPNPHPPDAIN